MNDAPSSWTEEDAGIPGHEAPLFRLDADPNISLVFLRLPDGNLQGQGFNTTGNESLQGLWQGDISEMHAVSGSGSYTKHELVDALVGLIKDFSPERVNTQDYIHPYGDGDHSDHHTTGYFVAEALKHYAGKPILKGYMGYPVMNETANVFGDDLLIKKLAFYAYGRHDALVCDSDLACEGTVYYPSFLERQHTLYEAPIANAGVAQFAGLNAVVALDGSASWGAENLVYEWTQVAGPHVDLIDAETSQPSFMTPDSPRTMVFEPVVRDVQSSSPALVRVTTMQYPENIAFKAKVIASSSNFNTSQTPDKADDEIMDGFPAGHSHEWATEGGKAGNWLRLSWDSPRTISNIALYDRPNLDDQITGAVIELGNGEEIEAGELSNYGTVKMIDVGERTVRNVTLKTTAVSPSTRNIGLSEIQVFGL